MNDLTELFMDELADILYAENLLLKALPKMAKAARSEDLKEAFQAHLEETEGHVDRLKQVFGLFGKPAKAKKCEAMVGLIEEGKEIIDELKGSSALDAGLICAAQKVEHYEIATYGCLCTWAEQLGNDKALKLLKQTIGEEKAADEKLTDLAESSINLEADEDSERMQQTNRMKVAARGGNRRRPLVS